jgi:hypothetical protein
MSDNIEPEVAIEQPPAKRAKIDDDLKNLHEKLGKNIIDYKKLDDVRKELIDIRFSKRDNLDKNIRDSLDSLINLCKDHIILNKCSEIIEAHIKIEDIKDVMLKNKTERYNLIKSITN